MLQKYKKELKAQVYLIRNNYFSYQIHFIWRKKALKTMLFL